MRAAFEAAYRAAYPISCEINPNKFAQEVPGQYDQTIVQVAWVMYKAGMRDAKTSGTGAGYSDIVSNGGPDPRNAPTFEHKKPDDTEGGAI